MLRYGLSVAAVSGVGGSFPWGTLAANILGSLVIGWLAGAGRPESRVFFRPEVRALLMVGFCGGLTTFSFFTWQTMSMQSSGAILESFLYMTASIVLGLASAWIGYSISIRQTAADHDTL